MIDTNENELGNGIDTVHINIQICLSFFKSEQNYKFETFSCRYKRFLITLHRGKMKDTDTSAPEPPGVFLVSREEVLLGNEKQWMILSGL